MYSVVDEQRVLDKQLSVNKLELTGALRKDANILYPVVGIVSDPTGYNYCYIDKFNRYYYITEVVQYRTNMWVLHLQVDVLKTYSSEIKTQRGVVDRYALGSEYAAKSLVKDVRKHIRKIEWDYEFTDGDKIIITRGSGA